MVRQLCGETLTSDQNNTLLQGIELCPTTDSDAYRYFVGEDAWFDLWDKAILEAQNVRRAAAESGVDGSGRVDGRSVFERY